MEQKVGKKNCLIVSFKIVSFVSFCRDKKKVFCHFPLFLSPPPSPPPSLPLSVYQGKVKEKKKKKGSPTTICTSSRAAPRTTEAEESTASTCDEPLCAPELRPSCVGLLPSWSHCEPTNPLPTATATDHQTSPSVGRKRSYTPSHMSGACTHVAQGLWPLPSNRTHSHCRLLFGKLAFAFFPRRSGTRRRFAGGLQSFNYVYSKIPPVKTAIQKTWPGLSK